MKNQNYNQHGLVRISAASPILHLAQPMKNAQQTLKIFKEEIHKENLIVVFPELGLTGYTCEDLFHTQDLLDEAKAALDYLVQQTSVLSGVMVIGMPYQHIDGRIYNMAVVISAGKILGMIPKIHLPNYNEFYEKRWFTSGLGVCESISYEDQCFEINPLQVFVINSEVILGVEICEDLWSPNPPSTNLALNGANIIVNLSASNELINKAEHRKELINQHSARLNCAYIYSSCGPWESSKDVVFSGHCLICENGSVLAESDRFNFTDATLSIEVDVKKLT